MEVYFRIYEEEADDDKNTRYQVAIHHPPYNVSGEEPLYELKEKRGTIKWQQASLDLSELKVGRDEGNIEISPKLNVAKRYARIIMDKETARKLANDILNELNK